MKGCWQILPPQQLPRKPFKQVQRHPWQQGKRLLRGAASIQKATQTSFQVNTVEVITRPLQQASAPLLHDLAWRAERCTCTRGRAVLAASRALRCTTLLQRSANRASSLRKQRHSARTVLCMSAVLQNFSTLFQQACLLNHRHTACARNFSMQRGQPLPEFASYPKSRALAQCCACLPCRRPCLLYFSKPAYCITGILPVLATFLCTGPSHARIGIQKMQALPVPTGDHGCASSAGAVL